MVWKVYYEPGTHHEEQPGREVTVNKTFSWGKQTWYLPAVYLCEKGLVMDLCVRGDTGEVKAFIEKWLPYELHMDRMSEELRELSLCLEARPVSFTAACFDGAKEGREVFFHHPLPGKEYTLTVIETEEHMLSEQAFPKEGCDYPRCCLAMSYTVEPELPRDALQVRACGRGDSPRKLGADGPTAVFASFVGAVVRMSGDSQPCTAVSALYFEPPTNVEWRIVLREKLLEDVKVNLLP